MERLWLGLVGSLLGGAVALAGGSPAERADPFQLDGTNNILAERHFGIVNGRATVGVAYGDVAALNGLWAPPYVSSDFQLDLCLNGQRVATRHYVWRPFQVRRTGTCGLLRVNTLVTLADQRRAGLLRLELENTGGSALDVPLSMTTKASLDRVALWQFATPTSRTATQATVAGPTLVCTAGETALVLELASPGLHWNAADRCVSGTVAVPAGGRTVVELAWAVGPRAAALADAHALAADPDAARTAAEEAYRRRVADLEQKLPRLTSDHPAWVQLYNRSLVHLLMNRWDVPEFVLRPYYSTGSVKGGCVCNYLWNFGENWEILPLADAAASRCHITQFLQVDMFHHFAFEPLGGAAFGPWYPVNQEKIVGLVYHYVQLTGDVDFLHTTVAGRTVLDHVLAQATYRDDVSQPVALIDYGPANNHLELRRGYPYNHCMPDLNGRRYASYVWAACLAELAGRPMPQLVTRADELARLLKQTLWNRQTRWFDFQDPAGRRDTRYTVQMFKLLASGVLDAEEEAGLLSHWNGREFLSAYGLHSMSKLDPAYDQVDIDNGGGGCCTGFPPQIAERLYRAGHARRAEDLLTRILWWGQRLPYWGDSLVANLVDYRHDTPLQCTVDGATVAQCLIFGMFGVRVDGDGRIRVCPRPPASVTRIALVGLKLRGRELAIEVQGTQYRVRSGTQVLQAPTGQELVIP